MAKYAEWYAVELDGYLRGRMSEVQRFEATKEILNHFAEHVDDLVSKGMDPVESGQSKGNVVGKWLISIGCAMITWLTFSMGLIGLLSKLQAFFPSTFWDYAYNYMHQSWTVLAVSLIAGTILTRRVPVVKMLVAGGVGIALIGTFFLFGPVLNYGNVPKDKFETMLPKWQTAYDTTVRLAQLEKSIVEATYTNTYSGNQLVFKDRALAIDRIVHEAPKMVASSSEYIKVSGVRIGGYLAPPTISKTNRWQGEDPGMQQRYFPTDTGSSFPAAQRTLKYYETAEEAISAWAESMQMYGQSYSVFGYAARDQEEFIQGAKKFGMLSGPQLFIATILPVVLVVLGFLISMMIIGWALGKLPLLTLQTSFRRRLA
jgi:hypothetical protein